MAYQFNWFRSPHAHDSQVTGRKAVIHRVTLADYPGRVFSVWTDESGVMLDAESRDARSGCRTLSVKRDGVQWETLVARVAQIWRFEIANAGVDGDKRKGV